MRNHNSKYWLIAISCFFVIIFFMCRHSDAAGDWTIVSLRPDQATVPGACQVVRWRAAPDRAMGNEVARLPYSYTLPQQVSSITTNRGPPVEVTTNYVDIAQQYMLWNGTDVVEMRTDQRNAVDSRELQLADAERTRLAQVENLTPSDRASLLTWLEELNDLRSRLLAPQRREEDIEARRKAYLQTRP